MKILYIPLVGVLSPVPLRQIPELMPGMATSMTEVCLPQDAPPNRGLLVASLVANHSNVVFTVTREDADSRGLMTQLSGYMERNVGRHIVDLVDTTLNFATEYQPDGVILFDPEASRECQIEAPTGVSKCPIALTYEQTVANIRTFIPGF